jgi:hypothetical protein
MGEQKEEGKAIDKEVGHGGILDAVRHRGEQ